MICSDDYAELLNKEVFLELVRDCYAWSAWQYFEVPNKDGDYREIPGSFNSYSGDFPLWRLSYTIIPYIREKFEHILSAVQQSDRIGCSDDRKRAELAAYDRHDPGAP